MDLEPLGGLSRPLAASTGLKGVGESTLVDFWQWAYSDVLSNGVRGVLAEYLVAAALGVTGRPRVEWDAVDLRYRGWGIEVKTTSAYQAWPLAGSRPSPPGFSVGRRRGWDASSGVTAAEASRLAASYVFCVYLGPVTDPPSNIERREAVLDTRRWDFHVVSTVELDTLGNQKRIGLRQVQALQGAVSFHDLRPAIESSLPAGASASRRQI